MVFELATGKNINANMTIRLTDTFMIFWPCESGEGAASKDCGRSKSRWMTGQNVTKGGATRRGRRTWESKPISCRRNATASWREEGCDVSKEKLFGNGIIFCVDTNL